MRLVDRVKLITKGGLSSYALLLMLVAFIQTIEYKGNVVKNEFPILGIMLVDFFNFYNSFELLKVEIRPFLPHDYINRPAVANKDTLETFIQIRGTNMIHYSLRGVSLIFIYFYRL